MSSQVSTVPRHSLNARQAETVERLLAAAAEELEEVGHEALTIRTVAQRAGVSPATAYTYVASKDHLFAELFWRLPRRRPGPEAARPDAGRRGCSRPPGTSRSAHRRRSRHRRRGDQEPARHRPAGRTAAAARRRAVPRPVPRRPRRRRGARGARGRPASPSSAALLQAGMGVLTLRGARAPARRRRRRDHGGHVVTRVGRTAIAFDPYDHVTPGRPVPGLRPAAARGAALPQRRARLLGDVAARRHRAPRCGTTRRTATRWASRSTRARGTPHAHTVMSFLAMDPPRADAAAQAGLARASPRAASLELEPQIQRITDRYLDRDPARERRGRASTGSPTSPARCRWTSSPRCSASRRRTGTRSAASPTCSCTASTACATCRRPASRPRCSCSSTTASTSPQRHREPTDDLTSALLAAEVDGDRMTDDEVVAFLFLMVVAGNETTTKLLGNALYHLTAHPQWRDRVFAGAACRSSAWIEETLRYDTSTQLRRPARRRGRHAARRHRPGRAEAAVRARLRQPGRRGLHRPGRLRPRPAQGRARPDHQLRRRPALLPRLEPGQARGPRRARRAGPPGPPDRGRPRRLRALLLRERARLRAASRRRLEVR